MTGIRAIPLRAEMGGIHSQVPQRGISDQQRRPVPARQAPPQSGKEKVCCGDSSLDRQVCITCIAILLRVKTMFSPRALELPVGNMDVRHRVVR